MIEITLKGITRPATLTGSIVGPAVDHFGATRVGLKLETVVDRTEFDMKWNMPLPNGEPALGNEVNTSNTFVILSFISIMRNRQNAHDNTRMGETQGKENGKKQSGTSRLCACLLACLLASTLVALLNSYHSYSVLYERPLRGAGWRDAH